MMTRNALLFGFALFLASTSAADAQMVVTGGRSVAPDVPKPTQFERPAPADRCRRRDRNPYYAARPVYPPAPRGARANVTFEPFTSRYYPNENSYYPPLNVTPPPRAR